MDEMKFLNKVLDLREDEKRQNKLDDKQIHIYMTQGNKFVKGTLTGLMVKSIKKGLSKEVIQTELNNMIDDLLEKGDLNEYDRTRSKK